MIKGQAKKPFANIPMSDLFRMNTVHDLTKVWFAKLSFKSSDFLRKTQNLKKNLPHGFDKSAEILNKCQNHEEDFSNYICVLK